MGNLKSKPHSTILRHLGQFCNTVLCILTIKANKMHCFSALFGKELCMLQTELLSIIRSLNTVFTAIDVCHTEILKMGKTTSIYTCTLWINCETCCRYIIYNKPTRCSSGSIVFIKNYKYALHVLDALCVHLQEHYKL